MNEHLPYKLLHYMHSSKIKIPDEMQELLSSYTKTHAFAFNFHSSLTS